MSPRGERAHDAHTQRISFNPGIIGLDGIVLSTGEANIFNNKRIVSQPDNLMFDPNTKTLYQIEYKCHDSQSRGHHAVEQLRKRYGYLSEAFPSYRVVNLYVHDDFKIEVLR